MAPIVLKLGGSLYGKPELVIWLKTVTEYAYKQPIVIVPGGGPFADHVRQAQVTHHFDDKTAHHMALIAMKQYGLLLHALAPESQPFTVGMQPSSALSIWLPDDALLAEQALSHSWDITSDSISLWLAHQLAAQQLILVKCSDTPSTSINTLITETVIDTGFKTMFETHSVMTKLIHFQHYQQLDTVIRDDSKQLRLS